MRFPSTLFFRFGSPKWKLEGCSGGMQSLSFRTVHTGFFLFLENISNPCNSEGGSFVSRMKRQNRVHTPAATHNKKREYIIMKKTVSVCMTAVMALSLLAGGAVQAYALSAETAEPVFAVAEENCIFSSWKRPFLCCHSACISSTSGR